MIPLSAGFLGQDFEIAEQPSRTYKMDLSGEHIAGSIDELNAVNQAIYKALNTERYQYVMYSWNYGIETIDLFGEPITYVCPELERRIREALLADSRITGVTDFQHDTSKKGIVKTSFTVHTIFGKVRTQKEVNV